MIVESFDDELWCHCLCVPGLGVFKNNISYNGYSYSRQVCTKNLQTFNACVGHLNIGGANSLWKEA